VRDGPPGPAALPAAAVSAPRPDPFGLPRGRAS
jgi:hypothetical protein